MKKNRLSIFSFMLIILSTTMVTTTPVSAATEGFEGPYEMQNWSSTGIAGGTTSINPGSGPATTAVFSYDVFIGNPGPGVSYRTTTFSAIAADSGYVSFDWEYSFFHQWFMVSADLIVFADGPSGTTEIHLVDFYNLYYTGPQVFTSSEPVELWVEEGYEFGFIVGGGNFDSYSEIEGDLTITNFDAPIKTVETVEIDIKPGSYPNSINPKSKGVIPVAILTTTDFDASTVDPQTVKLEGAGTRSKGKSGMYGSMEDIDGDGDLDLVVQIVNEIDWHDNPVEAVLTGLTWDGVSIEGIDSVNIVPH